MTATVRTAPAPSRIDTVGMVAAHIRALGQEPADYAVEAIVELAFADEPWPDTPAAGEELAPVVKVPTVGEDLFSFIVRSSRREAVAALLGHGGETASGPDGSEKTSDTGGTRGPNAGTDTDDAAIPHGTTDAFASAGGSGPVDSPDSSDSANSGDSNDSADSGDSGDSTDSSEPAGLRIPAFGDILGYSTRPGRGRRVAGVPCQVEQTGPAGEGSSAGGVTSGDPGVVSPLDSDDSGSSSDSTDSDDSDDSTGATGAAGSRSNGGGAGSVFDAIILGTAQ